MLCELCQQFACLSVRTSRYVTEINRSDLKALFFHTCMRVDKRNAPTHFLPVSFTFNFKVKRSVDERNRSKTAKTETSFFWAHVCNLKCCTLGRRNSRTVDVVDISFKILAIILYIHPYYCCKSSYGPVIVILARVCILKGNIKTEQGPSTSAIISKAGF